MTGAPLDLIKLVAAVLMLADHINSALVDPAGLDAVYAGLGSLCIIACAAALTGRGRFLPRYSLYAFYPGHLLALALWRAWA